MLVPSVVPKFTHRVERGGHGWAPQKPTETGVSKERTAVKVRISTAGAHGECGRAGLGVGLDMPTDDGEEFLDDWQRHIDAEFERLNRHLDGMFADHERTVAQAFARPVGIQTRRVARSPFPSSGTTTARTANRGKRAPRIGWAPPEEPVGPPRGGRRGHRDGEGAPAGGINAVDPPRLLVAALGLPLIVTSQ